MARTILEAAIQRVAAKFSEELVPAIPRVWHEEIAVIARDLRGWLTRLADGGFSFEVWDERPAVEIVEPAPPVLQPRLAPS